MAFGINRTDLRVWQHKVKSGEIAFLTHYWLDNRYPHCNTVTKVGCNDVTKLTEWGTQYGLLSHWIDRHQKYPHFDLFGDKQLAILLSEQEWEHIRRFNLIKIV